MPDQLSTDVVNRVKNSDKEAFSIIFNKYYDSLFANMYYKTKDYDLARDLAQETFIKCWDMRSGIDGTKSIYFWLVTIATNLANNYFAREQMKNRHHTIIKSENQEGHSSVTEQMEVEELQQHIDEIVSKHLPKKCQTIFIMSRFEGKSNSEIAEDLSISKKTVENQLYEALKIIRKKLKKPIGVSKRSFVLI